MIVPIGVFNQYPCAYDYKEVFTVIDPEGVEWPLPAFGIIRSGSEIRIHQEDDTLHSKSFLVKMKIELDNEDYGTWLKDWPMGSRPATEFSQPSSWSNRRGVCECL